jgi:uncharacterized membrane protein (DUF2068 family)
MKLVRVLVFLVLLLTAYTGFSNGLSDIRSAESTGQRVVSIAVAIYGITGLVSAYGLWRRKPWTRVTIALWGLSVFVAGSTAPRAYGGAEVNSLATITAVLACAVMVGAVLVFVHRDLKRSAAPNSAEAGSTQ